MASTALLEQGQAATPRSCWSSCGCDCESLTSWRANTGNRTCYKALSSVAMAAIIGFYAYSRREFPTMVIIGVLFYLKNMAGIWGQDTPTWLVPGSPILFCVVYVLGLPSAIWLLAGCPGSGEISFPNRQRVGLALFFIGNAYSFAYETGRFRWKKQPENKGKCHTVGLASLCIHPNYFGDVIAYNGWAIAGGSICTFSLTLAQIYGFLWFIIPNGDAYLAKRYKEFPAYAQLTAPLFPFVRSQLGNHIIAGVAFAASTYAGAYCTLHCE